LANAVAEAFNSTPEVELLSRRRLPLRSCQRRGAAIDVIVQRSRENRSQLVFTTARGRDAVFWQSPRPTARAEGIEELQILVDAHEQYPYRFRGSSGFRVH
jgi:hypothetical protein